MFNCHEIEKDIKNALVLDGQLKSALATVRSLGRHGVVVAVGAPRESGMALHSRYAGRRFVYPSPLANTRAFVDSVLEAAIRSGDSPVVYAFSDASYLALYAHREMLKEHMTLMFPSDDSLEFAYNKAATFSFAKVSGVPTITTYLRELSDIEYLAPTLAYPAVLKPRRSVTYRGGHGVFGTATFVHDPQALVEAFTRLTADLGECPLVQDFLRGEEYGVEMLAHRGVPYALVTHHRIRSLSPVGGASVLKETVSQGDLRETLEGYALRLAERLLWEGPIMVEFKVDRDTREPKLMEINGRFWGSLPLSVAAGVDVPYLYYCYAALGKVPEGVVKGKEHVTTRHFLGDFLNLVRVFLARDTMRKSSYPSRRSALRLYLKTPHGTLSDVWSWRDPVPAFMEIVDVFRKWLEK